MNSNLDPEISTNPRDCDPSALGSAGHDRPAPSSEAPAHAVRTGPAGADPPGLVRLASDPVLESSGKPGPLLSREELAAVSNELSAFFPQPFHETRVVLMVVDPHHIHAYWHIRLDDLDAARRQIGPDGAHAPIVLRFYDITLVDVSRQAPHSSFDVAVHGLQNNWYVHLWQDSKSYLADIGLCKPDGGLMALARSNVVHTSRSAESPHYERTGIVLEPDGTQRQVPDFVHSGVVSALPAQPTPQMPPDQSDSLVRQGYQRMMHVGRPGFGPPPLPGLKVNKGEF